MFRKKNIKARKNQPFQNGTKMDKPQLTIPLYEKFTTHEFEMIRFSERSFALSCLERSMIKIRSEFESVIEMSFPPLFDENTVIFSYHNRTRKAFENLEWLISYIQEEEWFENFVVVETCSLGTYLFAKALDQNGDLILPDIIKEKCGFILWAEDAIDQYGSDGKRLNRHITWDPEYD